MVIDKSNMLGVLERFPKQCREALSLSKGITVPKEITNIVVCGMGGSAIGGDILAVHMAKSKIAVAVVRDYNLPEYVDEYSLVFCVSYSGNTEETLSCFKQAKERNATVVAITSGGKLSEHEKIISIPAGLQPRNALGYLFFPMLGLLYNSGIVDVTNTDLNEMIDLLKDIDYYKQKGKEIAKKIKLRIPVIYSSQSLAPVAYRWKTEINENSKMPAFCNVYPEMNHNELVGYGSMERSKFIIILIRDEFGNERIQKRMDITKDFMETRVDVEEVFTKGKSLLARTFSTILLGDFVSYFLAMENRVDPTPVYVIENLKKKLDE